MSRHAFIDESIRGRHYMMAVTSIPSNEINIARRKLRSLAAARQRRIHFVTESDGRRRSLLKEMARLGTATVIYVATGSDQMTAREAILAAIVPDLVETKVTRVVLESREGQDRRDRSIIYHAIGPGGMCPFDYTHLAPSDEPLLWVPDAVAWAWGRDRRWRRLLDDLQLVTRVERIKLR